jgi:hypothetical protein
MSRHAWCTHVGFIADCKSKTKNKLDVRKQSFWRRGLQSFAEAMRTMRTGVILSSIDAPRIRLL